VLSTALCTNLFAQRVDDPVRGDTTTPVVQDVEQSQVVQEQLAYGLALCHEQEIELARLALEKSQQPGVRDFAQKMERDHTRMLGELKRFLPKDQADERARTGAAAEARGFEQRHPNTMMHIHKQAAANKLHLTRQMLEKYEGHEFNMGYVGQQMMAHVEMLAALDAMKAFGSEEFRKAVGDGITASEEHFKMAQMLSRDLQAAREKPDGDLRKAARPQLPLPR
jgi:predicted outer membrane protein